MKRLLFFILLSFFGIKYIKPQETIFADYFDINTNSSEGTPVIGGIHLESNKDVMSRKIPTSYHFEIIKQDNNLFGIKTIFDKKGRIRGVLSVNPNNNTGEKETSDTLTIALKNNNKTINEFNIIVYILDKTLWELFYERYMTIAPYNPRSYGQTKINDSQVAEIIEELQKNNGKFRGFKCYNTKPDEYPQINTIGIHNSKKKNITIDNEWINIVDKIGKLGYAFYHSKVYGIKGIKQKHDLLKDILIKAINTYISAVPIEGDEVLINGKHIGKHTGDATSLLPYYKLGQNNNFEHQWRFTDSMLLPILTLMPDIVEGIAKGDEQYIELHENLINYFQIFTALVKERREITNNPRWGEIVNPNYSSGAWADANLGHRSRTMLALPIIWADYNRPMTYVQYWYSSYYNDKPFKDFSLSPGWSPSGVVKDVSYWMTKFCIPSHHYRQSGFHPDGTVSHHIGKGTDAAMVAYGFELLTQCSNGYSFFKDTKYRIDSKNYQFQLDRLLNVYPKLFYKGQMDFLVSGRTFLSDLKKFVSNTYNDAVHNLNHSQSKDTKLVGMDSLILLNNNIQKGNFEYSGTDAYWVNEFLVHRRGENEKPYYASVKLKSERTVGAEDFSKIRKSWHAGYGILQVKVKGDEYDQQVLSNMDWHALPGLTEEWRTDSFPQKGGAAASLAGNNKIAGVLADGHYGMAIYHHLPQEKYSSASALKSYYFIEDRIIALGNNIQRIRKGQGKGINTFVDQTELNDMLSWNVDGKTKTITPYESVNFVLETGTPCWFHSGEKGYIVLPNKKTKINIKSGKYINITDKTISNKTPNFILSIDHGYEPGKTKYDDKYIFLQIPNAKVTDMSEILNDIKKDLSFLLTDSIHGVYSKKRNIYQFAFFKPGKAKLNSLEIKSDDIAMIMLKENNNDWTLSIGNPQPDEKKQTIRFITNMKLTEGIYKYQLGGIYPMKGETVSIKRIGMMTEVIAEIPDIRDEIKYNYQSDLYAAAPITIKIPK